MKVQERRYSRNIHSFILFEFSAVSGRDAARARYREARKVKYLSDSDSDDSNNKTTQPPKENPKELTAQEKRRQRLIETFRRI